jgi:hypothetical protein
MSSQLASSRGAHPCPASDEPSHSSLRYSICSLESSTVRSAGATTNVNSLLPRASSTTCEPYHVS